MTPKTSTYLITGATDGIGKALAKRLAATGAEILMHGRNQAKLDQAIDEVREASGNDRLHGLIADFASLDQVKQLAQDVRRDHPELNVLINNAGHLTDHRQLSHDGFELTFAVNYLAPFLLTQLLLDLLKRNVPARIINVSSTAMGGAYLDFSDLQLQRSFDGWQAYANSKLAQIYFTRSLAEQLADQEVLCFSLCPGLIDTNFMHTNKVFSPAAQKRMQPMMRPPEQGADVPFILATADEFKDETGHFFIREQGNRAKAIPLALSPDDAAQLWSMSCAYIAAWVST